MLDESIIKIIYVLAWPVTVLVLAFLFRKEIPYIVSKVSKINIPNIVNVEFSNAFNELELAAKNSMYEYIIMSMKYIDPYYLNTLQEIAKISPKSAILSSWRDIEIELLNFNYYENAYRYEPEYIKLKKIIKNIFEDKESFYMIPVYEKLYELKCKISKNIEYEPSFHESLIYIKIAVDFFAYIIKIKSRIDYKNKNKDKEQNNIGNHRQG